MNSKKIRVENMTSRLIVEETSQTHGQELSEKNSTFTAKRGKNNKNNSPNYIITNLTLPNNN